MDSTEKTTAYTFPYVMPEYSTVAAVHVTLFLYPLNLGILAWRHDFLTGTCAAPQGCRISPYPRQVWYAGRRRGRVYYGRQTIT